MKRLLTFIALTLVFAVPAGAGAADLKIGYVITQRLLVETEIGGRAADRLAEEMKQAKETLGGKVAELKELEDDLKKRAMVLGDDERTRLTTQYEDGVTEIKRLNEDMQARFKKIEMEVMVEVQEVIRDVIDEWGKANGYDLILDASTLVYVSDKADVTGKIIKAVDKSVQEGQ
ncbi:MAG: OmpH family outer membrane protein [Proteobacteria bacterium]|nr:OmpH family outer membrane protein [Pseudomonadota bacterium]